jgi:NadR type nicotinamide-nucleotide adenylyltransferase
LIKRIVLTGPESTGKSALAIELANHFNTVHVPEFARTYISELEQPYSYEDILIIAKGQIDSEMKLMAHANNLLFCDTDLTVTKIWCEFKYGKCHDWILKKMETHTYDIYLLCNIDLPWQNDPQREHPKQREKLFQLYLDEMTSRNLNFGIVSGKRDERLKNAIEIIHTKLNTK